MRNNKWIEMNNTDRSNWPPIKTNAWLQRINPEMTEQVEGKQLTEIMEWNMNFVEICCRAVFMFSFRILLSFFCIACPSFVLSVDFSESDSVIILDEKNSVWCVVVISWHDRNSRFKPSNYFTHLTCDVLWLNFVQF